MKLLFVFDAVWGRNLTLIMCCPNNYNVDGGCVFMFVQCMVRCRVDPGRTVSAFVLVCVWIWSCYSVWGGILVLACCQNKQQCRWRLLCVYVCEFYATVSCWPWTNSKCVCIGVQLHLKLLFVFDTIWGHNRALMCCPNTLQCRWRLCVCVRVRALNILCHDVVSSLNEQEVRLFVLVCDWIRSCDSCLPQYYEGYSHPAVLSKYTTMTMTAVRLCSLNVWNGVVLALDEQKVRLYWRVVLF